MRRTKITIERHEITIVRQRGRRISVYCEHCESAVAAFTRDETAVRFQIQVGEIVDLINTGEIHFVETLKGSLPLLCEVCPKKAILGDMKQ